MMTQLKHSEIKRTRERFSNLQKQKCVLCRQRVLLKDRVLDHCHITGRVRGMLHYDCNILLGKIENYIRYRGKRLNNASLHTLLSNVVDYISGDYDDNPLHPKHLTSNDKLRRKYKRILKRSKKETTKQKYRKLIRELT